MFYAAGVHLCYTKLAKQTGWLPAFMAGGKSELLQTGCWVTPRGGDPTESATETYRLCKQVRAKW
ncbi:hypothetical protein DA01_02250 [Dehalococcoides mccartyi]|uniref:Uncharacterized protein n=1 Tax=Dehalococcoides mccartyi TaxID=61435 RepID=A0A0V8M4Z2_9CHLR|nr:hypothetical protein DA01_02250 [Dehalococcoides mccartyi]